MMLDAAPAVPERMANLPRDADGRVIFWTAHVRADGTPDFRVLEMARVHRALKRRLCGMCGQRLGGNTLCTIGSEDNLAERRATDPMMHEDCARYALAACPFLSGRAVRRSGRDLPAGTSAIRTAYERDRPPRTGLAFTRSYDPTWRADIQGYRYAAPHRIEWFEVGA